MFTLPGREGSPPLDDIAYTVDGLGVVEFEATGRTGDGPDHFALIKQAVARFQVADSRPGICRAATEEVRSPTGFDRVMV